MKYVIGLDLGQAHDPTALAVIERPPRDPNSKDKPIYSLRHLKRFPLGTPYTEIVPAVARLVSAPPLKGSPLVVDQTGVGRALVDMLKQAKTRGPVVPVTITSGMNINVVEGNFHVPKKELVTCLQLLLQARRLKIARTMPDVGTLVEELPNFRVKITPAANEVFGAWREGEHDDLVLAVVLACWWAERMPVSSGLPIVVGSSIWDKLPAGVFNS